MIIIQLLCTKFINTFYTLLLPDLYIYIYNAHKNSVAHLQEKNSSYTAMPTARQKILSTSWNVQFVAFNTSEKLNNNLVNA